MIIKIGNCELINTEENNTWGTITIFSLMLLILSRYMSLMPTNTCNILILFLGCLNIVYTISRSKSEYNSSAFKIFVVLYTFCGILSFCYNSNNDWYNLLWPVGYMGIAYMMMNHKISFQSTKAIFYIWSVIIVAVLILERNGRVFNLSNSSNHISIYSLCFLSFVFIAAYQNEERVKTPVLIVYSLTCLLAGGRSGIITVGIIWIMYSFFDFSFVSQRNNGFVRPMILSIVIIAVIFFIFKFFPKFVADSLYKFESAGLTSQRMVIWSDYIHKCFDNPVDLLFGSSISGTAALNRYSENLHNSWLMLHATHGGMMFLGTGFLLIHRIYKHWKSKRYLLLVPCVLILVRMNFDYTNFDGCLDVALIYLMFSIWE